MHFGICNTGWPINRLKLKFFKSIAMNNFSKFVSLSLGHYGYGKCHGKILCLQNKKKKEFLFSVLYCIKI